MRRVVRAKGDPADATTGAGEVRPRPPCTGAAARDARKRRWREENRAALEAHAREVERDGLPLGRFRSF